MIKNIELKLIAVERQVPLATVERDYAQNWLLKYLNEINMVLKGGTGLRKVYYKEYRFSDDLDFTLLGNTRKRALTNKIVKATQKAKEESGINFLGITDPDKTKTGYKLKVGFRISQTMNVRLDITTLDNEEVVLPVAERSINHLFPDCLDGVIKAYDINEILVEKSRSIFQRGFPRDLYDVWYLIRDGIKINKELLKRKFEYKGVKMDISKLKSEREKIKSGWFKSLNKQIHDVPDFNLVFDKVSEILRKYEL